jgi:hypothetical protein
MDLQWKIHVNGLLFPISNSFWCSSYECLPMYTCLAVSPCSQCVCCYASENCSIFIRFLFWLYGLFTAMLWGYQNIYTATLLFNICS